MFGTRHSNTGRSSFRCYPSDCRRSQDSVRRALASVAPWPGAESL